MGKTKNTEEVNEPERAWCYTWNNYTEEDIKTLEILVLKQHRCTKEIGDGKLSVPVGTPHLQGCMIWMRGYRLGQLKKILPKCHWEMSKTVDPENYCIKGEVVINFDNRKQGKRTDWHAVAECAKVKGMKACAVEHPFEFIKFHKGLKALRDALQEDDQDIIYSTKVHVYWGESGSGKSRKVRAKCKRLGLSLYNVPEPINGSIWFDGYDGQDAILLDDFYGWIKYHTLLQWLDIYPLKVPYKGGYTNRKWTYVFITSNKVPEEWYRRDEILALERRITEVKEFIL